MKLCISALLAIGFALVHQSAYPRLLTVHNKTNMPVKVEFTLTNQPTLLQPSEVKVFGTNACNLFGSMWVKADLKLPSYDYIQTVDVGHTDIGLNIDHVLIKGNLGDTSYNVFFETYWKGDKNKGFPCVASEEEANLKKRDKK